MLAVPVPTTASCFSAVGRMRADAGRASPGNNASVLPARTATDAHSEHRFPAPSSKEDVVNQRLEFATDVDYGRRYVSCYSGNRIEW